MKYRMLVFDWDGTLMDSVPHIVDCIRGACTVTGAPFPGESAARHIIGLGMREALDALFGPRDEVFVNAFKEAYSRHFFSRPSRREDLFPGVLDVLAMLRSGGGQVAVATGKSWRGMQQALSDLALSDWFDAVQCADQTASKPDPLMLNQLLSRFDCSPEEALMVGDTTFDLEMASRAGMPCIGVSYGAHEERVLRAHGPLEVVSDLRQILGYIF